MTPSDPSVLRRKLVVIVENLRALERVSEMTPERYRADLFTRKGTERLLQELIEAAIDLNTHILVQDGHGAPDDYYQGFLKLADCGVLSRELAQALAPSAGLRNRLVHGYDRRHRVGCRPESRIALSSVCHRYRAVSVPSSGRLIVRRRPPLNPPPTFTASSAPSAKTLGAEAIRVPAFTHLIVYEKRAP